MPEPLLLIGASGQIGWNIMGRTTNRPVQAFVRQESRVQARADTDVVRFDLSEPLPLTSSPWPAHAVATVPIWLLPPHLEDLAARGTHRLVCFSTTSVFGKSDTLNRHERETVKRVSEAERRLVDLAGLRGVGLTILRPTLIYGEGQDKTITAAARFIRRFGFYPVHGETAGKRQPVHADDLAAAALLMLENEAKIGGSYALGGAEALPYREMITRIFGAVDKPVRIVRVPMLPTVLDVAGRVVPGSELTGDVARRMNADLDFDDGKAAREFGYNPRPFLQGGRADLEGQTS